LTDDAYVLTQYMLYMNLQTHQCCLRKCGSFVPI